MVVCFGLCVFFFFKQKTAYDMRISDWSSDVCSSDLEDDTLYPFLRQEEMTSLDYALRKTHFDGPELIPANLPLFQSAYEIAARMARGRGGLIDRLSPGISSISDRFDVIEIERDSCRERVCLYV